MLLSVAEVTKQYQLQTIHLAVYYLIVEIKRRYQRQVYGITFVRYDQSRKIGNSHNLANFGSYETKGHNVALYLLSVD
jgi:hypothetical protein